MIRHSRRDRAIAVCLSTLAGYVDALGFLQLGGYFVSFMTGNSTRLGVGVAKGIGHALLPLGLIALFVTGVVLGSLAGRFAAYSRPSSVLALVSALLAVAAMFAHVGMPLVATGVMALAMGAENAVFERDGEVSIGLTYMTGTLVKLGQRITAALLGGDPLGWIWYFLLWAGLATGAVGGAFAYAQFGLGSLWFAVAVSSTLALALARVRTQD